MPNCPFGLRDATVIFVVVHVVNQRNMAYIPKAKTKGQFALELGMSESTLRRRLKALNIPFTGRLLSPKDQEMIRRALGYPSIWPSSGGGQDFDQPDDAI